MKKIIDKYGCAAVIIVAAVVCYMMGAEAPMSKETAWWTHFTYEWSHGNIWHLMGNCLVIGAIAYSDFKTMWLSWLLAYLIACTAPALDAPTVGMSGICYAMMGMISWQAARVWRYHAWVVAFIAICALVPGVSNNLLHIWCYGIGTAIAYAIGWVMGEREKRILKRMEAATPPRKVIKRINGWRPKLIGSNYTKPKRRHRR